MPDHSTRMWPRLAGLAIIAAMTAGAATGAQAQPFFGYYGSYQSYSVPESLSPELVYRQLTRAGFQPLGRIHRNGDVFLADVIDPRRRQLRLVIDRMDGSILERYVIAPRVSASLEDPIPRPTMRIPDEPGFPAAAPEPRKPRKASAPTPRVIPAPIPPSARQPAAPRNEPSIAEGPAAMAPAPLPITPAPAPIERAPAAPPPRADGPGYANGVPINPLE